MRRVVASAAAVFLVTLSTTCDPSPPTDPHRQLALRLEADRALDAKNFVAHLVGANEVPSHDTPAVGEIKLQLSDDEIGRATSELQSHVNLVCRLLLKNKNK